VNSTLRIRPYESCRLARPRRPLGPAPHRRVFGRSAWADYGTLALRAARVAAGLAASGLERGDRVAIFMKNAPEYLEAMYAIWWAGLAAVPVNAKLHPREVEFIVADSGAKLVIDDPSQVAKLAADVALPLAHIVARRARLALLHQRHHRPPQGGDALLPQPRADDLQLFLRRGFRPRERRVAARGAALARLGPL
jgi:acyl-CoA synthetase (AMP-forming)/AMP-acid ligase II